MSTGNERQVYDVGVPRIAALLALGKLMGQLDYMAELMDADVNDLPGWGFTVSDEMKDSLWDRGKHFALEWASYMQAKHTPDLGAKARRAYNSADELPF